MKTTQEKITENETAPKQHLSYPELLEMRRKERFVCSKCKYCVQEDRPAQIGLCVETHSPRNGRGEPRKNVHLWALACRYGIPKSEDGQ